MREKVKIIDAKNRDAIGYVMDIPKEIQHESDFSIKKRMKKILADVCRTDISGLALCFVEGGE